MKNHGYELEHNFGHGKQFLAMTMAAFNLLAFAWHTILNLLEPPWQATREASTKRTRFSEFHRYYREWAAELEWFANRP